jgi:hypothetical protein
MHGVTRETARSDLLGLTGRELLERRAAGRRYRFTAPSDLVERLRAWVASNQMPDAPLSFAASESEIGTNLRTGTGRSQAAGSTRLEGEGWKYPDPEGNRPLDADCCLAPAGSRVARKQAAVQGPGARAKQSELTWLGVLLGG